MRFSSCMATSVALLPITSASQPQPQVVLTNNVPDQPDQPLFNIAIIGAGAGGSSAAFHLTHPLNHNITETTEPLSNITVFEQNSYIGGRSITVNAYDSPEYPVELGASVFVKVNHILNDAVRNFNLSTYAFKSHSENDPPGPSLGVWDGQDFVLTQNEGGWWDKAKLLWKYGLAPIKTVRLMRSVVSKFLELYNEPRFPFESLTESAEDLGLLHVTGSTGEQFLRSNGISGNFGWDVVQASTRVNYAQDLARIHGLEAMVCMAVEDAVSVEGGNWRMFEGMIRASGAHVNLETIVTGIGRSDKGGYDLEFRGHVDDAKGAQQHFDAVILAAPLQFTGISLPADLDTFPDKIPYVSLHVTLFTTAHLLSPAYFGLSPSDHVPLTVLTTLPKTDERGDCSDTGPPFYSISLLKTVTNPATNRLEYIYKIFSPAPLTGTFLTKLFDLSSSKAATLDDLTFPEDITWHHHILWHSYPQELPRVTFEPSRLDSTGGGLWYLNGMESFISTMETSALMGANVAALVRRQITKLDRKCLPSID